jgi:hypothetical protein
MRIMNEKRDVETLLKSRYNVEGKPTARESR